jgi:hypothetical protein
VVLERALLHTDLEEAHLNMMMLEEVGQLVAGKLGPKTGYLELGRICSVVERSKEAHYTVMGHVEWEAASCSGRFAVWWQAVEHKH